MTVNNRGSDISIIISKHKKDERWLIYRAHIDTGFAVQDHSQGRKGSTVNKIIIQKFIIFIATSHMHGSKCKVCIFSVHILLL